MAEDEANDLSKKSEYTAGEKDNAESILDVVDNLIFEAIEPADAGGEIEIQVAIAMMVDEIILQTETNDEIFDSKRAEQCLLRDLDAGQVEVRRQGASGVYRADRGR